MQTEIEKIGKEVNPHHGCCSKCYMDKYDCRCEDELKSKIEYIKEKFNITKNDLK